MENFNVGDTPISYLFDDEDISHSGIFGMRWGIRRFQDKNGHLTEEGKLRYYGKDTYRKVRIKELAEQRLLGLNKEYENSAEFKTATDDEKKKRYSENKKQAYDEKTKEIDEFIQDEEAELKYVRDVNKYALSRIDTGKSVLSSAGIILDETSKLIPNVKGSETHPDYSGITTEELKRKTERLNAEASYAKASGQMIYTPSKQELSRERIQTIGAVLTITGSVLGGIVLPIARHYQGFAAPDGGGGKKKK